MNPAKPTRRSFFGGSDKKQRLLMGIIGGGVILMLLVVVFSSFLGGSSSNTDRLVQLAQRQSELIRIAEIAQDDATDTPAKNLAATMKLSLTSGLNETIKLSGRELKAADLAVLRNADTDELLADAKQAGRFDEAFLSTTQSALTTYRQELNDFFKDSSSEKEKALLQRLYKQAAVLTDTTE